MTLGRFLTGSLLPAYVAVATACDNGSSAGVPASGRGGAAGNESAQTGASGGSSGTNSSGGSAGALASGRGGEAGNGSGLSGSSGGSSGANSFGGSSGANLNAGSSNAGSSNAGSSQIGGVGNSGGVASAKGGAGGNRGSGGSAGTAGSNASNASGGGAGTGGETSATEGGRGGQAGKGGAGGNPDAECGRCDAYGAPTQTGTVGSTALNALSGLAVSRLQPEILFAHNDGASAIVYALDLQGREHARITLANPQASDIEDIATGPCESQSCVYLADIGDNNAQRSEYAILRFAAPMVPASAGETTMAAVFERFRFVYDDGSHNAEGLMVAPDGTIYIMTKLAPGTGGRVTATGPSSIYRLPPNMKTDAVARATKVAALSVPVSGDLAASALAAHPCGQGFLLRTYDRVYEFVVPTGMSFEAAFAVTPKVVATPNEPQSEGIDYRADGRGFVTSGEGAHAPIFETACAP